MTNEELEGFSAHLKAELFNRFKGKKLDSDIRKQVTDYLVTYLEGIEPVYTPEITVDRNPTDPQRIDITVSGDRSSAFIKALLAAGFERKK
jgi:hypothetical protein